MRIGEPIARVLLPAESDPRLSAAIFPGDRVGGASPY